MCFTVGSDHQNWEQEIVFHPAIHDINSTEAMRVYSPFQRDYVGDNPRHGMAGEFSKYYFGDEVNEEDNVTQLEVRSENAETCPKAGLILERLSDLAITTVKEPFDTYNIGDWVYVGRMAPGAF